MAPNYLTDRFALKYSVHDCHTCNGTSTTCLQREVQASVNLLTSLRKCGTLSRNVCRMQAVKKISKTHILTVSHERCTYLQAFLIDMPE